MKLRIVAAGLACLLLAGCETTPIQELSYSQRKELAQKITDRCVAQGIALNSPEMKPCQMAEVEREVATREHNQQRRMAAALAMQNAGNQMQANARANQIANSINRPVNCTSRPSYGGTYQTSCY